MNKRPVVSKRKRAQALADRLQRELGLDACVPLLTAKEAAGYDRELPRNLFKFYLKRDDVATAIQVSRPLFLASDYNEDEFYSVIARVWLQHLQTLLAFVALQTRAASAAIEGER